MANKTSQTKKDDMMHMLRAIANGQSALKEELLTKINNLETKINDGFEKLNNRLDKQGESVAYLEDDAPTQDEFDELEKRVRKIEKKSVTI